MAEVKVEVKQEKQEVEIKIEAGRFAEVFGTLYSKWQSDEGGEHWGSSVDGVVIVAGSQQDEFISFPKSLALHAAMFVLELSDTLIAFGDEKLYFLAATKKAKILEEMVGNLPEDFSHKVKVLTRDKSDKDKANFEEVISMLKGSKKGAKIGTLTKEKNAGSFASLWDEALKGSGLEVADIQNGIADVLAIKTDAQLEAVKAGSQLCATSFKKNFMEVVLDIVDAEDAKKKMSELSEKLENRTLKMHADLNMEKDDIEIVIPPIIQSGGKYDLKYTAQTSEDFLHLPDQGIPAIHVASLSVRYKFCFCSVSRTLLFNAKREQSDNYKLLFEAFDACLAELKPGLRLNKIFDTATAKLKERKPELVSHLHKELGWGMGYEIREKRLVLDEKNKHSLHAGMVLCLRIGLENLELKVKEPRSQKYALLIGDTVVITKDGYEVCTEGMSKKYGKLSWNVSDEQEEAPVKKEGKKTATEEEIKKKLEMKFGQDKTRKMTEEEKESQRKQFEERNKQLAMDRVEEQRRRVHKDANDGTSAGKQMSQVSGYKGPEDFPSKASGSQLYVDDAAQVLLVPINGVPCPFHVSTIKNVSMQQQGTAGNVLRLNFVSPGSGMTLASMNKELMYLRELSYRAQEGQNLMMVHKQILDMKKAFSAAEREKKARDEIVAQEPLSLNPNRGPRLQNLRIYPNLLDRGKKTDGDLEAHVNGFRFTVKKAPSQDLKHIDVLYRNIKHAFFQPSNKNSNVILIHFRLKNPIMIGKQSARDIQFYLEWLEDSESLLENKRRSQYDRDEIEDENRQKQMVAKLDAEFKKFCDKVQDILPPIDSSVPDGDKIWEWDIPYAELEFQGTPKNSMVDLYPTVNCVVHLATKPVCIIELDNVDLVYYERLRAGNNNFDLAFVYKSFLDKDAKMSDCWERISTIDMKFYDTVREVMQKSKMVQFEGAQQVNWNNVLKDYVKNFEDISADGGWNVIFGNDSDEEEGEEGGDSDEDEDFAAESGSESDDGSEEDSDESSLSEYSEDDSDDPSEELSDEGMDSDEADAWAEKEDKRKREEDKQKMLKKGIDPKKNKRQDDSDPSDDDDRPKKKSKSGGGGSSSKSGKSGKRREPSPPPKKKKKGLGR